MNGLTKDSPRLSEALQHSGSRAYLGLCGECGRVDSEADREFTIFQECDEKDQREYRYVVLCERCAERLIAPHVRLYHRVSENAPAPGAMEICVDCKARVGLYCPNTKQAGGEGVKITVSKPFVAFMDGYDKKTRRRIGWREEIYSAPPSACTGKEI